MGIFSRKTSSLLPRDAAQLLYEYGRFRYDATSYRPRPGLRCGVEDPAFYESFTKPAQSDPGRFLQELCALTVERQDWATVGASRFASEEMPGLDRSNPDYRRMMQATIRFFESRGEVPSRLTGDERDFLR